MDKILSFSIALIVGASLCLGLLAVQAANDGRVQTVVSQIVGGAK